jgi:hypothetical protein
MKYAIEMASCGMIYIPSVTKTGKGVQATGRFSSEILKAILLILLMEGIYEIRR